MANPTTPLQPNYMKVFIQRDYSEGKYFILILKTVVVFEKIQTFLF